MAGGTLTFPLFNSTGTGYTSTENKSRYRLSVLSERELQQEIEGEVLTHLQRIPVLKKAAKDAQRAINIAEQVVISEEKLLASGRSTNFMVTIKKIQLSRHKEKLNTNRYGLLRSLMRISYLKGDNLRSFFEDKREPALMIARPKEPAPTEELEKSQVIIENNTEQEVNLENMKVAVLPASHAEGELDLKLGSEKAVVETDRSSDLEEEQVVEMAESLNQVEERVVVEADEDLDLFDEEMLKDSEQSTTIATGLEWVLVNHHQLNLRQEPALYGQVVKVLQHRTLLKVTNESADWLQVIDPVGSVGWVARYLTFKTTPANPPVALFDAFRKGGEAKPSEEGDVQPNTEVSTFFRVGVGQP